MFRASTLEERRKFYEEEFELGKTTEWFLRNFRRLPQICALDAGSDTKIILDKKLKNYMLYIKFFELKEKIKKYIPEDIYYDRNVYFNSNDALNKLDFSKWKEQELVFDVDSDNIKCAHGKKEIVCEDCLREAFTFSLKMEEELKKLGFEKIKIVYSGKGFHVHILDKKAFLLNKKERKRLTKKFYGLPIDSWVSEGNINLIRLPFSLNAEVSRKVIPLSKMKFDLEKALPRFLS